MQRRVAGHYVVHDLLLDFAKVSIANVEIFEDIKVAATSRQTQYLGRLDVLEDYWRGGWEVRENYGLYSLATLWRSVEDLAKDKSLEKTAYISSLQKSDEHCSEAARAINLIMVGDLFSFQVSCIWYIWIIFSIATWQA